MINPTLVKSTYVSFKDLRTMRKTYAPAYSVNGRIVFPQTTRYKTATSALQHSRLFLEGWVERWNKWLTAQQKKKAE